MPIAFIPFQAFVPDGGDYGPNLAASENMLPVFGSWRPLNQKSQVSYVAGYGPVTGAYVHIYQQAQAVQYMRADATTSAGVWLPSTGSLLWVLVDEVDATDTDFIYAPGAPTAQVCKLSLSNPPSTAGSTSNILRWRYRVPNYVSGTWTAKLELMQGTTLIATDTATGSGPSGWVQRTYTLTGPEVTAITTAGGYNGLFLQFTATIAGATQFARPSSDASVGGWFTHANATSNLFGWIDDPASAPVDVADFIKSSVLPAGGTAYTYVAGLGAVLDPLTRNGFTWRYRYRGANAGCTLVARLKQGGTVIKETTHTSIPLTYTTQVTALSAIEAAAITDFNGLTTEFVAAYPATVASTVPQYARPVDNYDNTDNWQNSLGTNVNLWSYIDEVVADDADFIYSNTIFAGDSDVAYEMVLGSLIDPLVSTGHIIRFRWRRFAFNANVVDVRVQLINGDTGVVIATVDSSKINTDNTYSNITYTLTAAEADSISNYANLRLRIVDPYVFNNNAKPMITWAELEVPGPRYVEVSLTELEVPSASRIEVSWAEFEVPDASTSYRGDIPTIIAGTRTKLWEVGQASWADISRGGGYAGAVANPSAWSMCSFGNHVVATNYIDFVQFRNNNTGNFADMITSAEKPKARFCVPFKESLLLGGINLAGHYDDEVWWSAVGNIQDFAPSLTTQSDYQRITSCPGQIMGLVGGDFALVFKRRSIHALDWVGGTTIVRVRDVSASIGTSAPKSIVSANGQVYFWGGNCFYRTDGYSAPVQVGDDTVARYLRDTDFSPGAYAAITPSSISEEDSLVVGWFDPAANLIFWQYQGLADLTARHTRILIYSPSDDRWSHIRIPAADLAYACQRGNVSGSERFLLKGTVGFEFDGANSGYYRFSGAATYAATFTTKRQAISLDENDRPMSVRITGVMPVMSIATNDGTWPPLTVTAAAANDVRFLLNPHAETYTQDKVNEAGWFPHDVAGTWVYISVSVPSMSAKIVTAFKGVYVRYEERGRS